VDPTPDRDLRAWLSDLNGAPETRDVAVRAVGMLGDRGLLAWLIHQMRKPPLATSAARAFLELCPQARDVWEDLTSVEPAEHGAAFVEHFEDGMEPLPVAARVKDWAQRNRLVDGPAPS